ncbi:hypothetical protein GGR16_000121 [Chelatococcus caeni]|uniref:Uncharacterized protein n=1 Tax=Chelatococcus caeni TaxID=1348468 RepID=A0A840BP75_9HYPH|nr:hypothetical protein [Chelatococcus caeni]MBB4015115.1 hypothetical protein [Chelatococcus caeni]
MDIHLPAAPKLGRSGLVEEDEGPILCHVGASSARHASEPPGPRGAANDERFNRVDACVVGTTEGQSGIPTHLVLYYSAGTGKE